MVGDTLKRARPAWAAIALGTLGLGLGFAPSAAAAQSGDLVARWDGEALAQTALAPVRSAE
ncbi:MAG: hypothetical protein ACK554_01935, partial [Erythrobacteraceae bacterium]